MRKRNPTDDDAISHRVESLHFGRGVVLDVSPDGSVALRQSDGGPINISALEYIHAADGEPYRHDFGSGVGLELERDGTARITQADGRPVWDEFDVDPDEEVEYYDECDEPDECEHGVSLDEPCDDCELDEDEGFDDDADDAD